ncbi:hypothetical protein [Halorubrum ezzemoulense]|uniref:hypothetical protein n=1 Tax=Halorubrum ezzemoulense TaxID=337243 RepID=UPI00232C1E95|nr:hypothetical protein [Halorubrum ezzemoulense]MDB2239317.1 hypothetical protein [Halorubrum ezzemoulense]
MSKRLSAALVVAVAIGLLAASAVGAANVSDVQASDYTMDVQTDGQTDTHDIQVTNSGQNGTNADVTITGEPSGVSVSGADTYLAPGTTTDVPLDITAGFDAESGTVSGNVNGEPFEFYLTVNTPPLAGFEDEPLDIGNVLVGQSNSGEVTVEQVSGDGSLDGVEITQVRGDQDATLDFSGGFSVSGSSGTVDWTVTPDSNAPQHEDLEWTVELSDSRYPDATREVDVEARVIYPGYFGELSLDDDEFTFDEPRDEGDTLTRTIDLEIPNDGDTPIEVGSVSASSSDPGVSVTASSTPNEIDGQSTEEAALRVTADRDLPEGSYDISATVDTPGFDGDDASLDGSFEIVHETRLVADDTDIGDVAIGEANSRTVTISEELGYNDVNDIETTLTNGPEEWLTLESAPSSVSAGGSEDASFSVEFDTSAELGESYEWEYDVDGDGDDASITVTASPVPLDLEPIQNELSEYDTAVADSTLELVDRMDERLRSGESANQEISTVLTFGEAATLYSEAIEEADSHLKSGEHTEAQSAIIRAAAAYNTMGLQAERLENDELRGLANTARSDAEGDLDRLIQEQRAYYEDRLESGEMSLIEEATTQRQLARIALLQGDEQRANQLENDAEEAFNSYSDSVSTGEQAVQEAESTWSEMEDDQFVVVLGQPLLLNPADYDAFMAGTASIDDAYQEAISAFESAGETTRAEEVTAEYESRTAALGIARYSLFGAIGAYALVAVGLTVRTARRMFWYVRDTQESVSGDFLV